MNVEIGAQAAQFPEKEYINGIAVAVKIWCDIVFKFFACGWDMNWFLFGKLIIFEVP
jgi:hypothetical protein